MTGEIRICFITASIPILKSSAVGHHHRQDGNMLHLVSRQVERQRTLVLCLSNVIIQLLDLPCCETVPADPHLSLFGDMPLLLNRSTISPRVLLFGTTLAVLFTFTLFVRSGSSSWSGSKRREFAQVSLALRSRYVIYIQSSRGLSSSVYRSAASPTPRSLSG